MNQGMRLHALCLLLSLTVTILTTPVLADVSAPPRIEFLLQSIGNSGCRFIRNGSTHTSAEAEKHLRMKYNRTRSRIRTAELFIDKLASASSWTGKPYAVNCSDREPEPSRLWLYRKLDEFREPE